MDTQESPENQATGAPTWETGVRQRRENATLGAIWRLRMPIYVTLALALTEWILLHWGELPALCVGIVLFVAPILVWIARGISTSITYTGSLLVLGSAVLVATFQAYGPMVALGMVGMAIVVLVSVRWRFKLRHLMVLLAVVAVLLRIGIALGSGSIGLALCVVPPFLIAAFCVSVLRGPTIERDALVSVLEIATRSNLPLAPAVSAFAGLCSPRYQRRVAILAEHLDNGVALTDAVTATPSVVPADARALLSLGGSTGTVQASLSQAVASRESRLRDPVSLASVIEYPLLILLAVAVATYYFMSDLGPKFVAILRDFGVPAPEPLRTLYAWLNPAWSRMNDGIIMVEDAPAHVLFLWCFATFGGVAAILLFAWALWKHGALPPTPRGWIRRRRETSALLRGLSVGVEAERPLPELLLQVIRAPISSWARRKWARVFDNVARGQAWSAALRQGRLIGRGDQAVLESAQRLGNLPWALRQVADGLDRRLVYRVRAVSTLLQPIALLSVGSFVLLAALTYFLPLVAMIETLVERI